MIIDHVETRSFRNLANATVELAARQNVISGDNAQGKTNFLEAVYVIACQQSFRAARTRELIGFGSTEGFVRAAATVGDLVRDIEVVLKPDGRRTRVDGKGVRSGSPKLDGLSAVLFSPEDLQIPRGAPSGRRRLLDQSIAGIWRGYQQIQRDYNKTLQSRNRLLKNWGSNTRSSADKDLLDVYDTQLATLGGRVLAARKRYIKALSPSFKEAFLKISRSGVEIELRYHAHPELQDVLEVTTQSECLLQLLRASRAQDIARRSTNIGPHTDDLDFWLDGRSARSFGSQGQLRAIVLAFKIVQIMDVYERQGHYPVLLLDDVSSELDPKRNSYLFDFIMDIECQLVVTTTRPELLPLLEKSKCFKVIEGSISV